MTTTTDLSRAYSRPQPVQKKEEDNRVLFAFLIALLVAVAYLHFVLGY